MQPKHKSVKVKNTDILVTKWKLFVQKRKTTPSHTHITQCSSCTFNFDMYLYVNASQLDLILEEFFNGFL